jgi:hypothetical protein
MFDSFMESEYRKSGAANEDAKRREKTRKDAERRGKTRKDAERRVVGKREKYRRYKSFERILTLFVETSVLGHFGFSACHCVLVAVLIFDLGISFYPGRNVERVAERSIFESTYEKFIGGSRLKYVLAERRTRFCGHISSRMHKAK